VWGAVIFYEYGPRYLVVAYCKATNFAERIQAGPALYVDHSGHHLLLNFAIILELPDQKFQ
jgi:hypothetical protein